MAMVMVLANAGVSPSLARLRGGIASGEGIAAEDEFLDGLAADEVLVDDAGEDFGGGAAVPDAFGVDDGDGALIAQAEAVGLGAVDAGLGAEALFEELPGAEAFFAGAALGLGLIGAQEDVTAQGADAEGARFGGELCVVHQIQVN